MNPVFLPFSPEHIFDEGEPRRALEETVLPAYLPRCRWFGAKARVPERFGIAELLTIPKNGPVTEGSPCARMAFVRVEYADGGAETYALPLHTIRDAKEAEEFAQKSPEAVVAWLEDGAVLIDAIHENQFRSGLMNLLASGEAVPGEFGEVAGIPGKVLPDGAVDFSSRVLKVEQSNSSVIYSDQSGRAQIFMKLFRKLEEGMNPDVEITRFLSEQNGFPHVPPFAGMLKYRRAEGEPQVLALALGMVQNDGDAWAFTLREVEGFYQRIHERGVQAPDFVVPGLLDDGPNPEPLIELLETFAARAWQLGVRTGQMHLALASESADTAFAPEPLTLEDQRALADEIRASGQRAWGLLSAPSSKAVLTNEQLADFQPLESVILARAEALASRPVTAVKTRTHGDYHLGQVLNTGDDFVIIDFEGEPLRPLSERKAKHSPLRDVAGMLRSFHYAAHSGLGQAQDAAELLPWAEAWAQVTSRLFLNAWRETTAGAAFVPQSVDELRLLLDAFLLEKALYEVAYELNNRPTWVGIPLRGIASVLRE